MEWTDAFCGKYYCKKDFWFGVGQNKPCRRRHCRGWLSRYLPSVFRGLFPGVFCLQYLTLIHLRGVMQDHYQSQGVVREHDELHSFSALWNGVGASAVKRARYPWPSVEAKMQIAIEYLRRESGQPLLKLGSVGFCWGGWAVIRSVGFCETPNQFVCGAALHPSPFVQRFQSEGPTMDEILKAVTVPMFLAPATPDAAFLRPDGWWSQWLNEAGRPSGGSESYLFNQKHGWANRGDLQNPEVKVDVDRVMRLLLDFLAKHLGGSKATPT